jgi:hypothetical protein
MTDLRILLDPTSENNPVQRTLTPRPATLEGLTIGLLDISKPRGDVFLDEIEAGLSKLGLRVKRFQKPTVARVVPPDMEREIARECDVVIEALAD